MRCSAVREAGVGAGRRSVVLVAALVLLAGLLAACSSASAKPVLTWYINPDTGGQDAVAKRAARASTPSRPRCSPPTPASNGSSWPAAWPPVTRAST